MPPAGYDSLLKSGTCMFKPRQPRLFLPINISNFLYCNPTISGVMTPIITYSALCVHWTWPGRVRKLQISLILVSSFIIIFLYGSIYTYGNLQPYLVSYIRERSHPPDLRFAQSTYMYSCLYALYSIGIVLGSFIERAIGPRMSVLIGGSLAAAGLCLSYFAVDYSFWLLMVTFGAMYGFGTGLIFIAAILCVMRWLPKWAGIANGFVTSGTGLSTFIFSPLQTGFINPSNKHPDYAPYAENTDEKYFTQTEIINDFPYIFLIEGSIFILFTLLTSIFMVNPEPDVNEYKQSSSTAKQESNLKPIQLIKKLNFYAVWLIATINTLNFGIFVSLYKSYGLEVVNASDYFLTISGVVSGFTTVTGRLVFGLLADRIDYKFGFVIQSAVTSVFLLTLYTTSLELPIMYFIWVCGIFLCYGGYATLFSITVLKCFGEEHVNANYAVTCTSNLVGVILSGVISDFCLSFTGWLGMFWLMGGASLVQLILSLMITPTIYTTKRYTFNIYSILNHV